MNKKIKEFDEYKSLIISFWVILWWYLQIIWLWWVWLEYIRFFSSTQIISDWILWIILILFLFWIVELCNQHKWLGITTFAFTVLFSMIAIQYHYYSIAIFLTIWMLNILLYGLYFLFKKLVNTQRVWKLPLEVPKWVILWMWISFVLVVFWYWSTYIWTTPATFYINDKIKSEMEWLGTWTKLQYFNDKYIFLVNDSDKLRKVKVLKSDDYLLKY